MAEAHGKVALVTGATGQDGAYLSELLSFDASKPEGTPRKLMCGEHLPAFGWNAGISLSGGARDVYRWFLDHQPVPV